MSKSKPRQIINGSNFSYGGEAAKTSGRVPGIVVNGGVDVLLKDLNVSDAPFVGINYDADVEVRNCTNTTPSHAMVLDGTGDVKVDGFRSQRTSKKTITGWDSLYSDGWNRIFGKEK